MFSSGTFVRGRRRNPDIAQFLALTALFGCGAIGLGLYVHLSSQKTSASAPASASQVETVSVVVPIQSIDVGIPLDVTMFRLERRPALSVGPEIIRDVDELKGQFSKGILVANLPVHRDYLTSLQPINRLTASIPSGFRAIALPVDVNSSVEGWAQPGARVDVLWTTNFTGKKTTTLISPNVKVLSANRQTEATQSTDPRKKSAEQDGGIPRTVTLLLSQRDALKIRLASLHGQIGLTLRGSDDKGSIESLPTNIDINDLYSLDQEPQVEVPRNLVSVQVKDQKTGQKDQLLFDETGRVLNR